MNDSSASTRNAIFFFASPFIAVAKRSYRERRADLVECVRLLLQLIDEEVPSPCGVVRVAAVGWPHGDVPPLSVLGPAGSFQSFAGCGGYRYYSLDIIVTNPPGVLKSIFNS